MMLGVAKSYFTLVVCCFLSAFLFFIRSGGGVRTDIRALD